jgi:carboxylate-amine ligase
MRTVGVEEEFLLVRRASASLAPLGDEAVAVAGRDSEGQYEHELKREQVELGTQPHESLTELADDLRSLRTGLAQGAERHGARLAALATSPLDQVATSTADPRYERMTELFGLVGRQQLTCGMHVHVAVDSPDEGVRVLDALRPWLPLLRALSANSPYFSGQDTGYASYRTILWGSWPSAGAGEPFGDLAGYETTRTALIESGAALDDGMIYFDARLSAR